MRQTLHFEHGKETTREFHTWRLDAHHFSATATDIVGTAYGECYGNALHLRYIVAPKAGNPFLHLRFDQWLYLPDESDTNTMFTRVVVSKLGIRLGQISEVYHRVGAEQESPQ